jgi:hypothetical protein
MTRRLTGYAQMVSMDGLGAFAFRENQFIAGATFSLIVEPGSRGN